MSDAHPRFVPRLALGHHLQPAHNFAVVSSRLPRKVADAEVIIVVNATRFLNQTDMLGAFLR